MCFCTFEIALFFQFQSTVSQSTTYCTIFKGIKNILYTLAPLSGRIAQREKKINQFGLWEMFWGCFCDSKLPRMKFYNQPFWRAVGTQADKSAKLGQNGLCMPADISKMAQGKISFFAILNHINIPKTNCLVRICCTF